MGPNKYLTNLQQKRDQFFRSFLLRRVRWPDPLHVELRLTINRFDDPSQAADMIEKLDRRFIEALGRDITVRPAYINLAHDEKDGSPKRIDRRRAGQPHDQDSRDSQNEYRNQGPSETAKDDFQSPMAAPSNQLAQNKYQEPSEQQNVGASRPAPVIASSPSNPAFQRAKDIKADDDQKSTPQSGTLASVPNCEDRIEAVDPNNVPTQGSVAAQPNLAAQSGKLLKQKTPSPKKKKKNGKVNQGGSVTEGMLTSKERKAMLSALRTERSNTVRSDTTTMPASHPSEPFQASNPTESSRNEVPKSNEGTMLHASGAISPSDLRKELSAVAGTRADVSSKSLSRMQSTSHSEQGSGLTSLMISTNPTSYAHSEGSESRQESTQIFHSEAEEGLKAMTKSPAPIPPVAPKEKAHVSPVKSVASASTPEDSPKKIHWLSSRENHGTPSTVEWLDSHPESQPKFDEDEYPPLPEPANKAGTHQSISKEERTNVPVAKATKKADSDKPSTAQAGTKKAKQGAENRKPAAKVSEQTPRDAARGGTSKDLRALVAVPNLPPIAKIRKVRAPSVPSAEASDEGVKSFGLSQENTDKAVNTSMASLPPPTNSTILMAEQSQVEAPLGTASPAEHHDTELEAQIGIDRGASERFSNEQDNHEAASKIDHDSSDAASSHTLDGDSFATAQATPEKSPDRAVHDAGDDDSIPQSNEKHPSVEQKKKKKSKKTKKPKQSKTSQTDAGESSGSVHPEASTKDENTNEVVVPKAETPFLSDENTQLAVPSFPMQNHSSMGGGSGRKLFRYKIHLH